MVVLGIVDAGDGGSAVGQAHRLMVNSGVVTSRDIDLVEKPLVKSDRAELWRTVKAVISGVAI